MTGEQFTKDNEGLRLSAYRCPSDHWTIGYGHNLEAKGIEIDGEFLRGQQICDLIEEQGLEITKGRADRLFDADYADATRDALSFLATDGLLISLTPARRAAIVDMSFQMGLGSLRKFVNTRKKILAGDWKGAARGVLNSLYARQTPNRAKQVAYMLCTGEWYEE